MEDVLSEVVVAEEGSEVQLVPWRNDDCGRVRGDNSDSMMVHLCAGLDWIWMLNIGDQRRMNQAEMENQENVQNCRSK